MKPTLEQIKKIIEESRWYQSGDNSQPWTYVWGEQKLRILHSQKRAVHPLNPGCISSALSLGCLIEALSISASRFGYGIEVQYNDFAETEESCWASVEFNYDGRATDSLFSFMKERCTDRRNFKNGDLKISEIEGALENGDLNSSARIHYLSQINPKISQYIVNSEKLLVEHRQILPTVLQWTRFTRKQGIRLGDGLSLRNMGVRFWEIPGLFMVKHFNPLLQLFKPMLLLQHTARVKKQLESSAGLVCVSIPRGKSQSVPEAGRAIYRVWLELTREKYGVQPLTIASTLTYCAQESLLEGSFSKKWISFFKNGESILRETFEIPKDRVPVWMIRTGLSTELPKEDRTFRRSVDDILKIQSEDSGSSNLEIEPRV